MGSSPRTSGTQVMAVPAGEECSVPSAGRKPARCPHRHADQPVNSFQPRGGRRPRRPDDRRTSSYISNRQRQRCKREADSKLRIRFAGNPACRPGRKSRNHPVSCASLSTFCAHRKYPPEAGHADSPTIFAPEHPTHSAPHLYRLPFFSVRIDGEGRWVYHTN